MTGVIAFQDSFDMYNGSSAGTGLPVRYTSSAVTSWGVTTGRFGGQCLDFTGNSGGAGTIQTPGPQDAKVWGVFDGAGATTAMAIGFAFIVNGTRQDAILDIQTAAGGQIFSVGVSATGQLIVCTAAGGTVFTGSAGVITFGTWYYMEIEATINASTGTINLYLNGTTTICTLTSQNTGSTGAGIFQHRMFGGGSTSLHRNVDDLYVVTGAATRLGESRIECLRAAADSVVTWTPKTGVTNYNMVNETQVDGDTSYVQTATSGNRDLYTNGGLSSTPANIWNVDIVSFSEKTDATARTLLHSVKSGATISDGSAFTLLSSYNRFDRMIPTDPNTSAAWTASGVNNLLFGPKAP